VGGDEAAGTETAVAEAVAEAVAQTDEAFALTLALEGGAASTVKRDFRAWCACLTFATLLRVKLRM
jgi:hypothetical protein